MTRIDAVKLARKGVSAEEIAERCKISLRKATALTRCASRQQRRTLENTARKLVDLYDELIDHQAQLFRELMADLNAVHAKHQRRWDGLSARIVRVLDEAEKLLPAEGKA